MKTVPMKIRDGIVLFAGKMSRNLMLEPVVSNTYFLEDGDEMIIFDPSCGKKIAESVESHMQNRCKAGAKWKKAVLIAGHSHIDHANNFYLSDLTGAGETHIYVHEAGFKSGRVSNEPVAFIRNMIEETKKSYNPYLAFSFPYNLLMYPFAALDVFFPDLAVKLFSRIGALPWPGPVDGEVRPEPLIQDDAEVINFGNISINGWRVGKKIILSTPGHSPCSVSLFWPEKKALFVSDADWIGNPVFMSSSIRDCIDSLERIKKLTCAGEVVLFLPAHGQVKEGRERIMEHLEFLISRLKLMRSEVMSAYQSCGKVKDVRRLTKVLVQGSPLFKTLKLINYPRFVLFIHNVVAVCLKEEGVLD
ncbi:MAG: MBL fold metallo-hydrolase [Desulfobacteraceae bacterium]|nr:MBL fold metallo-hydrolase [Desulfobacteraceae bacterium]MBC2757210.1 MBL fold metallo-hydrolase [Desulfobacteraceae bacterium]